MPQGFVPVGPQTIVHSVSGDKQNDAIVVALAGGGYVVTWTSKFQDGSLDGVFARIFDANGTPAGAEFQVNTGTVNDQNDPTVTALDDGGFIVAWASDMDDEFGHFGLYGQRFNAAGTSVGAEFLLDQPAEGEPVITALADGGFLSVFATQVFDGAKFHQKLWAQRYDLDGNKVGDKFNVNTAKTDRQDDAMVTVLDDGGYVIAWTSKDGFDVEVFAQRFDVNGGMVGPEFQVNTHTVKGQWGTSITTLEDGGFVVVWTTLDDQDGDNRGVYGQRYDAAGNAMGGEFLVNTATAGPQEAADVTALPDGGFVVVWLSAIDFNFDGVFGQRYDANGQAVGDEFTIVTNSTGFNLHPSITTLSDGSFVVTWDYSDGQPDVFSQHFEARLFGTSGDDTLTDTAGADWMNGQWGHDFLYGLDGADLIYGKSGNDLLDGGEGKDDLRGGKGDDTLIGGGAKDHMTGGAGADTFVFNDVSDSAIDTNIDRIKDFEVGVDTLDFSNLIVGDLAYVGTGAFTGTAGEVRIIEKASGKTNVFVDADGDGVADMKIIMAGVSGLGIDDFIL